MKKKVQQSFFARFNESTLFKFWNEANTLLELALKLGLPKNQTLMRYDYEYIETIKTRGNWKKSNSWIKSRQRYFFVAQLSAETLQNAANLKGIETLSHLALHFLLSPKHGRKIIRNRILELNISVKDSLHKGVYGVSKNPFHWPTPYYEKRVGLKPMQCPRCYFHAKNPQQIHLHHVDFKKKGSKIGRETDYYKTKRLSPLCANCHSLEHRTGNHLLKMCGQWRRKLPGTQKYKNPDQIFSTCCQETYRMQKQYYIKWYLTSKDQYKCQKCSAQTWGKKSKVLTLELHHVDKTHKNSTVSNLMLLCPNCHAAE